MSFAICLQVPNHIHFKKRSNIWTEFVPQILFLQSIFGYLVCCIIFKWVTDWSTAGMSPPGLLNMLIFMFLSPGSLKPEDEMFRGQGPLQVFLLLLAAVCVPWMLCVKPYLLWKEHKKKEGAGYRTVAADEAHGRDSGELGNEEEGRAQGEADAEDDEEHVRSRCPTAIFSATEHVSLGLRVWRGCHPPNHSHYRVLPWLHFQHGLLPSSLGPLPCACPAQ
jgi:V-type H+-transporting ATPase subunit a